MTVLYAAVCGHRTRSRVGWTLHREAFGDLRALLTSEIEDPTNVLRSVDFSNLRFSASRTPGKSNRP